MGQKLRETIDIPQAQTSLGQKSKRNRAQKLTSLGQKSKRKSQAIIHGDGKGAENPSDSTKPTKSNSSKKNVDSGTSPLRSQSSSCNGSRRGKDDDDDDGDDRDKKDRKLKDSLLLRAEDQPAKKKIVCRRLATHMVTSFSHLQYCGYLTWFSTHSCPSCSIMKYFWSHVIRCTSSLEQCNICSDLVGACCFHMNACQQGPEGCRLPFCRHQRKQQPKYKFGIIGGIDQVLKEAIWIGALCQFTDRLDILRQFMGFTDSFLENLKALDVPEAEVVEPLYSFNCLLPKDEASSLAAQQVLSGPPSISHDPNNHRASSPRKPLDLDSGTALPVTGGELAALNAADDGGSTHRGQPPPDSSIQPHLPDRSPVGENTAQASHTPNDLSPFGRDGWTCHLGEMGGDTGLRLSPLNSSTESDNPTIYPEQVPLRPVTVVARRPPRNLHNCRAYSAFLRQCDLNTGGALEAAYRPLPGRAALTLPSNPGDHQSIPPSNNPEVSPDPTPCRRVGLEESGDSETPIEDILTGLLVSQLLEVADPAEQLSLLEDFSLFFQSLPPAMIEYPDTEDDIE